jgi:predicted ATPase
MIESITFRNFRVLRNATLPLGPFTLLIGPNGSGKTTAIQGLLAATSGPPLAVKDVLSAGLPASPAVWASVLLRWGEGARGATTQASWQVGKSSNHITDDPTPGVNSFPREALLDLITSIRRRVRAYSLQPDKIAQPVALKAEAELERAGGNLAIVLDRLRDHAPERFEALNRELARWLPEFDHVLFDVTNGGQRLFSLRTTVGRHKIAARDLSSGTLIALAILCLAYLPEPPSVVCLEEPNHGIHPRLLRDVRDALYRLAYPKDYGESREPVQVIATTHSPYMLDLFREHPEEVVIASKVGEEATFQRLVDHPEVNEILGDAPLGEVWYSGILGGVPTEK